uniref:Putative peptide synthetase n=1 Tax=Hordeum vulgare TaxID=4513 RepID=A9UKM4_HORVU|nr:putative peptide synthetase [Hordeum vulgare]
MARHIQLAVRMHIMAGTAEHCYAIKMETMLFVDTIPIIFPVLKGPVMDPFEHERTEHHPVVWGPRQGSKSTYKVEYWKQAVISSFPAILDLRRAAAHMAHRSTCFCALYFFPKIANGINKSDESRLIGDTSSVIILPHVNSHLVH